jgi:hypothetical protein
MALVGQIALGIVLSFVLIRHLPLIVRAAALVLLALVMVFLLLCFWPAFRLVRWSRRSDRWWARKHSPDMASRALGQQAPRIPHSG